MEASASIEPSWSAEDRLILLLAPAQPASTARHEASALIADGFRWERFLDRVSEHDVHPLVRRNLLRLGLRDVPEEVLDDLGRLSAATALRNMRFAEELDQVLKDLSRAHIPAIPLKGAPLAEALYGDAALRASDDIDVLVPRSAVKEALGLLLDSGYRAQFAEAFFADLFLKTRIDYALISKDSWMPHYLELHWGILWGDPFDGRAADDLWDEARPAIVCGAPAYLLSPEWELLFLSAHAARHRWQGLKWLVDIHEICLRGGIDWERLRLKAERLGWSQVLGLTLAVVRLLFETPVPEGLAPAVLPPWLKVFPDRPAGRPRDFFFPLRLMKRPSDRLRFLARLLFVPGLEERQLLRLPSALGFLYYPLRLARLSARWGLWLVRAPWRRQDGTSRIVAQTRQAL